MTGPHQDRSSSPSDLFAERVLYARSRRTGKQFVVRARVGRPYWIVDGVEAACLAGIEGFCGPLREIRGIDCLDALRNAMTFVYILLGKEQVDFELRWPSGELFEPPD